MKSITYKSLSVCVIMCVGIVTCAGAAWFGHDSSHVQTDLASLRAGASLANCENCQNRFSHFYECYHETMDPRVLCRTDVCIENKHWYIECSPTCQQGDCVYHYDFTQMWRWQERKYASCSHSGENPFWRQKSHACAPSKGEKVRCITGGCSGVSWGTAPWYGREVCGL
jgi:hypothetical protein